MKKILIIEDNDLLRHELSDMLGFEGYETIGADNGQEGILLAQKHAPHLVISDINLPILNGFEVFAALHHDLQTADIPVIFLSARSDRESVQSGLQLGAAAYLTKPCPINKLLAVIRSQIGN